jgi:hypothetical protein
MQLSVLNPKEKMKYFKKHWSKELQGQVIKCVEEVVSEFSQLHRSRLCGCTRTELYLV